MGPGGKGVGSLGNTISMLAHLFEDFSGSMYSFGTKIGGDTAGTRLEVS